MKIAVLRQSPIAISKVGIDPAATNKRTVAGWNIRFEGESRAFSIAKSPDSQAKESSSRFARIRFARIFQEEVTLTWMECWLYLKPCRSDSRAASSTDENTSDEETSDNCCVLVLENKHNENSSSRVQNQTIRLSSSSLPLVSYFFINYLALAPTTWVLL